jgi:hypothetical protein
MQLRFPLVVEGLIDSVLLLNLDNDKQLFIRFDNNDSLKTIRIYEIQWLKRKDKRRTNLGLLISSTNRYYQYETENIPVVYGLDFDFGFPSFTFSHALIEIEFYSNKWFMDAIIVPTAHSPMSVAPNKK